MADRTAAGDAVDATLEQLKRLAALHGWRPDTSTLAMWRDIVTGLMDERAILLTLAVDIAPAVLRDLADTLERPASGPLSYATLTGVIPPRV